MEFQYLGSRGAQLLIPRFPRQSGVSILGLARSPTNFFDIYGLTYQSFNTWAREEPNASRRCAKFSRRTFQYLGSRGAQPDTPTILTCTTLVSILGLARSPTGAACMRPRHSRFQYLGSRGAQPSLHRSATPMADVSILGLARSPTCQVPPTSYSTSCFNTWAREEPNCMYLFCRDGNGSFNTWAREEPNTLNITRCI